MAYWFPPLAGIGSIRTAAFARLLPDFGWDTTVLAPATGAHPRDGTLVFAESRVVRTRIVELSRVGKAVVGTRPAGATSPSGLRGGLRRFAHRHLYFPDAQIGWYPFALAAGRALLVDRRFDVVLSSSFPITAHLVARNLSRTHGVPWVAEFRDPWADVVPGAREGDRRDRMERSIVSAADAVVTVSPAWRQRFLEKGARRAFVVTNGFDPEDIQRPAPSTGGFVVAHLGSLYPEAQELGGVWRALAQMRAEDRSLQLRIRLVGAASDAVRAELAGHGLSDALEVTGYLPHRAALAALSDANVLIASGFHASLPLSAGVIPAKVFEYLGSGLPILYIGAATSDAARLLAAQPGCRVVAAADTTGTVEALRSLRGLGHVARDAETFTRRHLAGELARVLDAVCAGQPASSR